MRPIEGGAALAREGAPSTRQRARAVGMSNLIGSLLLLEIEEAMRGAAKWADSLRVQFFLAELAQAIYLHFLLLTICSNHEPIVMQCKRKGVEKASSEKKADTITWEIYLGALSYLNQSKAYQVPILHL